MPTENVELGPLSAYAAKNVPAGANNKIRTQALHSLESPLSSFEALADNGMLFNSCEGSRNHIDIWSWKRIMIQHMSKIVSRVPNLKVVFEQLLQRKDAADFVCLRVTVLRHHYALSIYC